MTQYYCYTRSEYRAESSSMWIFLVCLLLLFFPPVFLLGRSTPVHRLYLLSLINCFSSGQVRLVQRRNCSCSYRRQFRFSQSIVYALLLARSTSVRRLFLLFSSINASLLASFAVVRRLFLLFYSPVPLRSVDCFCSSSRPFRFSPSIVYALLVY